MTSPRKPSTKKPQRPTPKPKPGDGPEQAPPVPEYKSVTVKDRVIEVRKPTEEQLFAWDRILRKLEQMAKAVETANQARRLMDKCDVIINAVIVNEDDKDWLEDGQLDGTITLEDAGKIVLEALKAYESEIKGEPANRAARRAKA